MGKTLFEKYGISMLRTTDCGEVLLYIDRHLIHEVTSPQFEGLSINNRPVRHPELTFATTVIMFQQIVELE